MQNAEILDFIKDIESDNDIEMLALINEFINNPDKISRINELLECLDTITIASICKQCDPEAFNKFIEMNLIVIAFLQSIK